MQFEIILHGNETPEQINRCLAALSAYAGKSSKVGEVNLELRVNSDNAILELEKFKRAVGSLDLPDSVGEKLEVEPVNRDDETLAKLEAENPQFGKQPLPEGAGPLAPPPPPSAPSPAAAAPSTSAPAAAPVSSADLDKNGLPWDERIHASSRAKIADGSWRMKRGVQQHVVDTVEAELRGQAVAAPPPPAAPMTIRTIPVTGGEPDAAPAPPLPPAAPALTFGMVAKRVTAKLTLGELTTAELTKRLAELGFPDGLHTINSRPDMWLTVLAALGA